MKYALGNMLNGAGGLNADQLSLDLQFAADKTLTARKGPTPVFTRGSSATLVNSAGLIEYAPENLLLRSEEFGTTWVTANTTISSNTEVSPDGNTTADTATVSNAGTNFLAQQVTVTASTQYTFSFYVKRGSATNATYSVFNNNANNDIVPATSYFSQTSSSAWVRVSFQFTTPVGCTSIFVYVLRNTGSTGSMHFWGAQLEVGPLKSYNRTRTSAFYGPRFDHDPVTLASRGLLIEESRTNVFLHSEDLTQTAWGKNGATISANATTAPDGATTADGIVDDTTTASHRVVQSLNATAGITYTASCFIKRNQVTDFFQIAFASANFGTNSTWFNISNGTIVSSTGNASPSTITALPNGWYRVTHTVTCTVSNTVANVFLNPSTNSTTVNYTGTGVLTVFLWGAQLEAGSFATSYIPTTTASVVRSADVCSITGAAFSGFYNATEGTSFISAIRYTNVGNPRSLTITNGTSGNRAEQTRGASVEEISYYAGGSFLHSLTLSAATVGVNYRIAHAMAANNFAASMNGASPVVNSSGAMLTADRMIVGANFLGTGFMNGTISAIRYYKKRLPNAKLQALTAP